MPFKVGTPFCISGGSGRAPFMVHNQPMSQHDFVEALRAAGHDVSKHCRAKDRVVVVPRSIRTASAHKQVHGGKQRKVVRFKEDMLTPKKVQPSPKQRTKK